MSSAMRRMIGARKGAQKAAKETAEKVESTENAQVSSETSLLETTPSEAPAQIIQAVENLALDSVTQKPISHSSDTKSKQSAPKTSSETAPEVDISTSTDETSSSSKSKHKKKDSINATNPLTVSPHLLNPEHEIKRIYGNIRLWDEDSTAQTFQNQLTNNQKKNLEKLSRVWGGKDKRTVPGTSKKLSLVTIKPYWIPQIKSEMSVSRDKDDTETSFKFTHSESYTEGEMQFLQRRQIGQDSSDLFPQYPYNVSILNQLASNGINSGQASSESADLIERALFVFNRALLTSSQAILGQSKFRFKYVENRQFYRTLYLYIDILARRGLWNTALEYCKLIYSLDDEDYDPYGCRYMMDHFAVQAGDTTALKYMVDQKSVPPHVAYSLALALILDENEEAEKSLEKAIKTFPWIGYTLAESLGINNHRFDVLGSTSAIEAQSQLYVLRNKNLWDDPRPKMIFTKVWASVEFEYSRNNGPDSWYTVCESLKRHLVISGEPTLLKYAQPLEESDLFDDDPVPPKGDENQYGVNSVSAEEVSAPPEMVNSALQQINQLHGEAGMDLMDAIQMVSEEVPQEWRPSLLFQVTKELFQEN